MVRLMTSRIETRERVQPHHANAHDTLHGGNLMKWMDNCAAMSASRFSGMMCVTVNVQDVDFNEAVPVGDIVAIESYVYRTGETSVNVCVDVAHEDPFTGEQTSITTSSFKFVAVDGDNTPQPTPELEVETTTEEELQQNAEN